MEIILDAIIITVVLFGGLADIILWKRFFRELKSYKNNK